MPGFDPTRLTAALKAEAARIGFDGVGVAQAGFLDPEARRLETWLAAGRHGGADGAMAWMERNVEKRLDPRVLVPGARSVVSVFKSYWPPGEATPRKGESAEPQAPPAGRVARYAGGDDYHDVLKDGLAELFDWLDRAAGGAGGRAFVDSAPVMDKAWAQRAGLGWIGKNTNLLTPGHGSFVFLGELIVDVPLVPDAPFTADHCGSCTRCLDACPTDALDAPYQIDATRCISYWTIEHRGDAMPEIASEFGSWLFGCDICQEVCPWTRFSQPTRDARLMPRPETEPQTEADLREWLELDLETFRERFRKSPIKRSKLAGLTRNVEAVLRNRDASGG